MALSMFRWRIYIYVYRVNLYLMAICLVLLELGVIVGTRLGLGGFMKGVPYRVSYTVSNIVSARKPSLPLPSFI